jgi:hypothetical protein
VRTASFEVRALGGWALRPFVVPVEQDPDKPYSVH